MGPHVDEVDIFGKHLKAPTAENILEEIKAGRENLYINPPLLELLSDRA